MTALPLTGRSVVVTRPRTQAGSLAGLLERVGATVVALPVIAIDDPADGGAALDAAAGRLAAGVYDWVALTSSNAAARLLTALGGRRAPGVVRWAAIGTGTATVLAGAGVHAELVPTVSLAGSLADAFPLPGGRAGRGPIAGTGRVLFARAEAVSGALAAGLRAKGWEVDEVVAYRTTTGDPDPGAIEAAAHADAVAFTSSSTVVRTLELLGPDRLPPVVATIGPITSASARSAGVPVAAEADPHTLDGLVAAVVEALTGPGSGPPPGRGADLP